METHIENSKSKITPPLNLDILPEQARLEVIDFYYFLVNKYVTEKPMDNNKKKLFENINKHRFTLPTDYKFDRDEANER